MINDGLIKAWTALLRSSNRRALVKTDDGFQILHGDVMREATQIRSEQDLDNLIKNEESDS